MPKKKSDADGASPAQSFLKPVPAPSSARAWSGTQAPAADPVDIDGYVPIGDFRRDYVFMCKRLGISPHPSVVQRIRRPMTVVEVRRFRRLLARGTDRNTARTEALKATHGKDASAVASYDARVDAVAPDAGYELSRELPVDPDAPSPQASRQASRPSSQEGAPSRSSETPAGAEADASRAEGAAEEEEAVPPAGGECVPMDAFDLTQPLSELSLRGCVLDSGTVAAVRLAMPFAASISRISLYAVEVSPSDLEAVRKALLVAGSRIKDVSIDWCTAYEPEEQPAAAGGHDGESKAVEDDDDSDRKAKAEEVGGGEDGSGGAGWEHPAAAAPAEALRECAVRFVGRRTPVCRLSLRGMGIGAELARRLLAPCVASSPRLEALDLGDNPLGDDGIAAVMEGVRESKSIRSLCIARCGATCGCVGPLVEGLGSFVVRVGVDGDGDGRVAAGQREELGRAIAQEDEAQGAVMVAAEQELAAAIEVLGGTRAEPEPLAGEEEASGGKGDKKKSGGAKGGKKKGAGGSEDKGMPGGLRPVPEEPADGDKALRVSRAVWTAWGGEQNEGDTGPPPPRWAAAWVKAGRERDEAAAKKQAQAANPAGSDADADADADAATTAASSSTRGGKTKKGKTAAEEDTGSTAPPEGPALTILEGAQELACLDVTGNALGAQGLSRLAAALSPHELVGRLQEWAAAQAERATADEGEEAEGRGSKAQGKARAGKTKGATEAGKSEDSLTQPRGVTSLSVVLAGSWNGLGGVLTEAEQEAAQAAARQLKSVGVQLLT